MDSIKNPFAPGAGNRPPELAGRQDILDTASVAIQRIKAGRADRSPIIVGLRGVGKTVMLIEINHIATSVGCKTARTEAYENTPIKHLLIPPLRKILLSLDSTKAAGDAAGRGLRVLKSFLSGTKVKVGEIEISLDYPSEKGVADSGLLDADLTDVFVALGEAAHAAKTAAVVIIDELQYLPEEELGALIMAIHRVSQDQLPVVLVGAGLPQLVGNAGRAKSYAERLFIFPELGALSEADSAMALQEPARAANAVFTDDALAEIFKQTKGYPYFLQEWGSQAWKAAATPTIGLDTVRKANKAAIASLDKSFFRVRFDRLTRREKDYLRALAELGEGAQTTGDVSHLLGMKSVNFGALRNGLITKGMIYAPLYGETAFTVPLFDEFMKREMPVLRGRPSRNYAKKHN